MSDNKGIKVHQLTDNMIHFTTDYDVFNLMEDNRSIEESRKRKISMSINDVGYIPAPIVVNEKMEIIDGQGRFAVMRDLGIPIAYVIVPGLGIRECISMNISGTQWKDEDYIKSFANQGNENYERLRKLLYEEYPGQFALNNVLMATVGKPYDSTNIRKGSLTITEEAKDEAYNLLGYVSNINRGIDGGVLPGKMVNAIVFAVQVSGVDSDRLSRVVERNYTPASTFGNIEACLEWLTFYYNQGVSRSIPRIRFENEYEDAVGNKESWYAVKWGWTDADRSRSEDDDDGDDVLKYQARLEF